MKDHVFILLAHYDEITVVRAVFKTFDEAVKARKIMEAKKLNMNYSIGTYQVWETVEQAQAEDRL
jgi:hypothetical protein